METRLYSVVIHALPLTAAAFLAFFLANTLKYKLKLGWGWLPLGPTGLVPLALCWGLFPNTVPCSPYPSRWVSLQPSSGIETSSKKELAHGHTVRQLGSQDELALPDSSCCIWLVCNVVDVEEDLGVPGATREATRRGLYQAPQMNKQVHDIRGMCSEKKKAFTCFRRSGSRYEGNVR